MQTESRYKTDINRIQEYTFNVGIALEAATSGRYWGRVGYWGKRERERKGGGGGGELGSSVMLIGEGRGRG